DCELIRRVAASRSTAVSIRNIRGHRSTRRGRASTREGTLRLVGGQSRNEGNVEIYHAGKWGSICDDEWDLNEANIVCKSLRYELGALRATVNSEFGRGRKLIWMDNVYCNGNETHLHHCPFDGWRMHDCNADEAAGVVCNNMKIFTSFSDRQNDNSISNEIDEIESKKAKERRNMNENSKTASIKQILKSSLILSDSKLSILTNDKLKLRIAGGRHKLEGRVELYIDKEFGWGVICANGWGIFEAMVVCRQLGLGHAEHAVQSPYFGGQNMSYILNGVKCRGHEASLQECTVHEFGSVTCSRNHHNIAGVICAKELPDLVLDANELESSIYLEDRQMVMLQCAMEENCLSTSAYSINFNDFSWLYETRRLLRFTARTANLGTADFRPFLPKHVWQWHACHRHYHSMEVFAHFDILNSEGKRVAEGHKASFCLEDNSCVDDIKPKYKCANYGDQGISVGCTDTYLHNIDCQWIDITDMPPGMYHLKISVNPEFKIAELNYDNNAVICSFLYNSVSARVWNCTSTRP
ncbi:Lysyl oxidase-like protein, partial [Dinothrombium tinctorium]